MLDDSPSLHVDFSSSVCSSICLPAQSTTFCPPCHHKTVTDPTSQSSMTTFPAPARPLDIMCAFTLLQLPRSSAYLLCSSRHAPSASTPFYRRPAGAPPASTCMRSSRRTFHERSCCTIFERSRRGTSSIRFITPRMRSDVVCAQEKRASRRED